MQALIKQSKDTMFFLNDPEHVGASFEYLVRSSAPPDIYIMICGRVTPAKRDIIKIDVPSIMKNTRL